FFQAEDGIRDFHVTGVQTCALPISTFEVPSEGTGILRIKAQEGETLEIGEVICEIEESDGKSTPSANTAPKKDTAKEESKTEERSEERRVGKESRARRWSND